MADIKINADVSSVKKSLQEITQSAKALGKSPIDLLSPTTVKMLQGEANAQLGELQNKAKALRNEMEAQARAVDKAARGTKKYADEMAKLANLSKQVSMNQSQQGQMKAMAGPGGFGGGGMMGKMGGMRGLAGMAGGGLMMAGGAALAYGAGRVGAGINRYKGGIGERIQMRGMGMDPTMRQSERAAGVGMDQGQLRQARMGGVRAFGAAGGGEGATLKRAEYERSFGLDQGKLSELGGSMRAPIGGKAAAEDIQKTLESAVSAGLEDADIAQYLETAVGLLESIDSSGIKDRGAMLQALSDVSRMTGEAPEKIAKGLGGIDAAIGGSSGEANAFFQQAFAKQGGGTIGGAQFATEGGLTGMDLSRVAGLSDAQRGQLGGMAGGGASKRAGSILKQFKAQGIDVERLRSGKASTEEQIVAGRFAKQLFGTKTAAEGLGQLGLLSDVAKGGPGGKAAGKKLRDAQKTLEEKSNDSLKKIAGSQEGVIQRLDKIIDINSEKIGERAGKYYAKALELMAGIESFIGGIAKFVGYESPEETQKKEAAQEKQKDQHAVRIAKGEIAKDKLAAGEEISKKELQQINTAERLKKKHGGGLISDVDDDVRAKIQQEKGKISRKQTKKEAAQIEGSPLQSTADSASAGATPETPIELLKNISDQLTIANEQRGRGNKDRKDVPLMMRMQDTRTNTFGGL